MTLIASCSWALQHISSSESLGHHHRHQLSGYWQTTARQGKHPAHICQQRLRPTCAVRQKSDGGRGSRKSSFSSRDVNDLAQLMPDPQDTLLDENDSFAASRQADQGLLSQFGIDTTASYSDEAEEDWDDMTVSFDGSEGSLFSAGKGGAMADLPPEELQEVQRALGQLQFSYRARRRFELEAAQDKAMELHHRQMERAQNRYAVCLRLGQIMEEIEMRDAYEGDEENPIPSWIRAHFALEAQFEELNAAQKALEQRIDANEKKRIQDEAMAMLDSAMQEALVAPAGEAAEGDGIVEVDPLDAFLGDIIPGASLYDVEDLMSDALPGAGMADGVPLDDDQLEDLDLEIGEEF